MSNNNCRFFYIYEITNNINGKNYIGQRYCPANKTPETDTKYMGKGVLIVKAEKKYGIKNFSKRIMAYCYTKEIVDILETEYIDIYKAVGKAEYNIAKGGRGTCGVPAWNKGKHGIYTEEQRKHLSETHKGKKLSLESIEKLKETVKDYKWWTNGKESTKALNCPGEGWILGRPEEYKLKQSESLKGHPPTKGSTGMHWYTNGVDNIVSQKCPNGFIKGRCEEYKIKLSNIRKNNPGKNKGGHWYNNGTESRLFTENPNAEWCLGRDENYKKILSESTKGRIGNSLGTKWWTNGTINMRSKECPGENFRLGRSEEISKKLSISLKGHTAGGHAGKGLRWFNDGINNIRARECPEGFVKGRIL